MAMLELYTNPMSRGRIARWMLEELGQPYDVHIIPYPHMKSPDYLAINPMGKVPAVKHGDVVVTEAAAICAYLADAFPDAALAPAPGDPARAPYYRWLFFGAGPIEAAVTAKALGLLASKDKSAMVGYGSYEDVLDTLESAVSESPYLAGDRFSAADLYVGAQVGWGLQFGTIEKRPAFQRYYERLAERPAGKRANELDDAEMAKMNQQG